MKKTNDLANDPIYPLILKIVIPSMIAQFVSVLYSIVDRMYIGNIETVGDIALAGVGVCGPILTMISSLAHLIGVGGAPLAGISMGEGDLVRSRKILSNAVLFVGILSVLVYVLILPFRFPILQTFGASVTTLTYAEPYFFIYLLGTPFMLVSVGLNQFVICQGHARQAMQATLLGAISNIILDPIFIFVLNFGVRGAAIATILSQLISACYVLYLLTRPSMDIRLEFSGWSLSTMKRIFFYGLSPCVIIALDNVMIIAMNALLQKYGGASQGDMLITCATIVQSFMLIVTMPLSGISAGSQGLISYHFGACLMQRLRKAYRFVILLCVLYNTFMFIFAWTLSPYFVAIFTDSEMLVAESIRAIRICTLFIIPLGIQYAIIDMFTAMSQVQLALPLSLFRKLVYFTALFILPVFGGARAIFYAEPISDIIAPICTILVFLYFTPKVLAKRQFEVENKLNH